MLLAPTVALAALLQIPMYPACARHQMHVVSLSTGTHLDLMEFAGSGRRMSPRAAAPPPPAQLRAPAPPSDTALEPQPMPATESLPQNSGPQFDVVSVRPNRSMEPPRAGFFRNGFEAVNASLRQLIDLAYGGDPAAKIDEVVGGPGWLGTERFDISARGELTTASDPQRAGKEMLQRLLEERFRLRVLRERRERPIYSLVIARPNETGPGLRPAPLDCHTRAETRPPGASGLLYCGIDRLPGQSIGRSMPVHLLADTLSSVVGRHVVDRTRLTGEYDWDLAWTPSPGEPPSANGDVAPPPDAATIFSAVKEQLGLRLEAGRALLDVLVIDSVDRPTAN